MRPRIPRSFHLDQRRPGRLLPARRRRDLSRQGQCRQGRLRSLAPSTAMSPSMFRLPRCAWSRWRRKLSTCSRRTRMRRSRWPWKSKLASHPVLPIRPSALSLRTRGPSTSRTQIGNKTGKPVVRTPEIALGEGRGPIRRQESRARRRSKARPRHKLFGLPNGIQPSVNFGGGEEPPDAIARPQRHQRPHPARVRGCCSISSFIRASVRRARMNNTVCT